jgi:hypothetical protein
MFIYCFELQQFQNYIKTKLTKFVDEQTNSIMSSFGSLPTRQKRMARILNTDKNTVYSYMFGIMTTLVSNRTNTLS